MGSISLCPAAETALETALKTAKTDKVSCLCWLGDTVSTLPEHYSVRGSVVPGKKPKINSLIFCMRCTKEQVRYVLVSGQAQGACLKSFTSHSGLYCRNSKEFGHLLIEFQLSTEPCSAAALTGAALPSSIATELPAKARKAEFLLENGQCG